ncbi:hypothetical protein KK083_20480 [Fulvivirgaceae bacterium PWU4]|uniref:Uncharacterized protein n=1 Tax=Chryseosolibacter histidini TaxID=2782349 RepID=A0AAP2DMV7_9BACT|nr:hypothetical protein [Chryseosolibacter histidini]MBT1699286.1 hypothetical protein [Chryseosolibacter histidini]
MAEYHFIFSPAFIIFSVSKASTDKSILFAYGPLDSTTILLASIGLNATIVAAFMYFVWTAKDDQRKRQERLTLMAKQNHDAEQVKK